MSSKRIPLYCGLCIGCSEPSGQSTALVVLTPTNSIHFAWSRCVTSFLLLTCELPDLLLVLSDLLQLCADVDCHLDHKGQINHNDNPIKCKQDNRPSRNIKPSFIPLNQDASNSEHINNDRQHEKVVIETIGKLAKPSPIHHPAHAQRLH